MYPLDKERLYVQMDGLKACGIIFYGLLRKVDILTFHYRNKPQKGKNSISIMNIGT